MVTDNEAQTMFVNKLQELLNENTNDDIDKINYVMRVGDSEVTSGTLQKNATEPSGIKDAVLAIKADNLDDGTQGKRILTDGTVVYYTHDTDGSNEIEVISNSITLASASEKLTEAALAIYTPKSVNYNDYEVITSTTTLSAIWMIVADDVKPEEATASDMVGGVFAAIGTNGVNGNAEIRYIDLNDTSVSTQVINNLGKLLGETDEEVANCRMGVWSIDDCEVSDTAKYGGVMEVALIESTNDDPGSPGYFASSETLAIMNVGGKVVIRYAMGGSESFGISMLLNNFDSWTDEMKNEGGVAMGGRIYTVLTQTQDKESDAYLVSSVADYIDKPTVLMFNPDNEELVSMIGSVGNIVSRDFLVIAMNDASGVAQANSIVSPVYADETEDMYVIEVSGGKVTGVGIPDEYAISSETQELIDEIVTAGLDDNLTIKYINTTDVDADGYAIDLRSAETVSQIRAVLVGLNEWESRPSAITSAAGSNFAVNFASGAIASVTSEVSASCEEVKSIVNGIGSSYTITTGGKSYSVKNGALQGSCSGSNNNNSNGNNGQGDNSASNAKASEASPNNASKKTCAATTPVGVADLFQIERKGTDATIYFTPVSDYTDRYHVIFGNQEGDERYSGVAMQVSREQNTGVLAIDVHDLDPSAQYSFKVAPVNDCAVGEWSNWLTARGVSRYGTSKVKTYRYTGK